MGKYQTAIKVNNLTKTFRIPIDKTASLKGRVLGRASRGYKEITPLNGISFEINKGDFFGIVGRNGSGKSTLLRTIAGIYTPTQGAVRVDGSLVPFIELGVGFNPQLSGRENVYLNAALLGFSRQEVDEMYDDIVEFAELKNFMEERLQNYSSGMQVRLAFSIAIRAKTDILLLDEVLAVGDTAFQEKCFDYFRQVKSEERTVVLVTHNMNHIRDFCNRGLLLEEGNIKKIGSSDEVADAYGKLFTVKRREARSKSKRTHGNRIVRLESLDVINDTNNKNDNPLRIIANILQTKDVYTDFNVTVEVRNLQDLLIFSTSSTYLTEEYIHFKPNKPAEVRFNINNLFLGNGSYYINLKARATNRKNSARTDVLDETHIATFIVGGYTHNKYNLIHPPIEVNVVGADTYRADGPGISEKIEITTN